MKKGLSNLLKDEIIISYLNCYNMLLLCLSITTHWYLSYLQCIHDKLHSIPYKSPVPSTSYSFDKVRVQAGRSSEIVNYITLFMSQSRDGVILCIYHSLLWHRLKGNTGFAIDVNTIKYAGIGIVVAVALGPTDRLAIRTGWFLYLSSLLRQIYDEELAFLQQAHMLTIALI